MNQKAIGTFRSFYESALAKRVPLFAELIQTITIGSDDRSDEIDCATAGLEQHLHVHIQERLAEDAGNMSRNLAQIRKECFGLCQSCGEEISVKRLEALPTAILCVECQEESEREVMRHRADRMAARWRAQRTGCLA